VSDPVITATGAVSGFGAGVEALWTGLLSGASRVEKTPAFSGGAAPVCRVPDGALPGARDTDWTFTMLAAAAREIQASPAWGHAADIAPHRLGVCVGTTQGPIDRWLDHQRRLAADPSFRPDLPALSGPVHRLAKLLGARGPVACPSMACASGSAAIGLGLDWIRADLCDAVVAGGVDALSEFVHTGFANLRALDPDRPRPFDGARAGLCLGEGAGLVLLARAGEGPALVGHGQSADANHLTGPDPTGAGVARAMGQAFEQAGVTPDRIDFISAHGTATVFNDLMESKAFTTVFGADGARRIPVNSIKGALGHTMGAAGALEAVVCTQVLQHGLVPPTAGFQNLDPEISLDIVSREPRPGRYRQVVSTSSGFGGVNVALVLAS
jgi:3-oxoacyl-[acyl-carrier-protein] synthase II